MKAFFKSRIGKAISLFLLKIFVWILNLTYRYKHKKNKDFDKYLGKKPVIVLLWHSRILAMHKFVKKDLAMPCYGLFSSHRDGKLIADLLSNKYLKPVLGSSNENSVYALKKLIKLLRENNVVGITPDGPLGPRFNITTDSAFHLAKQTGAVICPLIISGSRVKIFNSWDRFFLFKPFSRIFVKSLDPIFVDKKISADDMEKMKKKVEDLMVKETQKMDLQYLNIKIEKSSIKKDIEEKKQRRQKK